MSAPQSGASTLAATFGGCLLLLVANIAAAYSPIGALHAPAALLLAGAEVFLLAGVAMQLRHAGTVVRAAAIVPLVALALLLGMLVADWATRT